MVPSQLRVSSYNILAPLYVRPIDKRLGTVQPFAAFEWCEDSVLDWKRRKELLKERISKLCEQSDVVSFQEVEYNENLEVPEWLIEACGELKVAVLPSARDLNRNADRNERVLGVRRAVANLIVSRFEAVWSKAAGTTQLSLAIKNNDFVIINVHLDAADECKRLDTIFRAIAEARSHRGPTSRIIICGDWNVELGPASVLGTLLSNSDHRKVSTEDLEAERVVARFDGDLDTWQALRVAAHAASKLTPLNLLRVETGATRCGFDHDGSKRLVSWQLDHIVYDASCAQLINYEPNPLNALSLSIGTPNHLEPSDHAPVLATLVPIVKSLDIQDNEAFSSSFSLANRLDALLAAEAVDIARAHLDAADLQSTLISSSSKKNRTKPTDKERLRIQQARKLVKDSSARKRERRRAFVASHITPKPLAAAWLEKFIFDSKNRAEEDGTKKSKGASVKAALSPCEAFVTSLVDVWILE